jgi:hypothetical protein
LKAPALNSSKPTEKYISDKSNANRGTDGAFSLTNQDKSTKASLLIIKKEDKVSKYTPTVTSTSDNFKIIKNTEKASSIGSACPQETQKLKDKHNAMMVIGGEDCPTVMEFMSEPMETITLEVSKMG